MSAIAPEVTVVVPARNVARWLPRSLASIGPREDLEILVVDDGSTDATPDLLRRFAAEDLRLSVLEGPRRGPGAARNRAIAAARAPLVAFLDADDRWRLDKLAVQLALHAARPRIGFSFTDYWHLTESGEDRGACFPWWPRFAALAAAPGRGEAAFALDGEAALAAIYAENVVGTSTVVARTDLLRAVGGFDERRASAEDWDLWLRLAARAPVGCVPRVLADYTMHRAGNLSNDGRARLEGMRAVAARHGAAVRAIDPGAARACAARLMVAAAEAENGAGHRMRAGLMRLRALALRPSRRLAREAAADLLGALRGGAAA